MYIFKIKSAYVCKLYNIILLNKYDEQLIFLFTFKYLHMDYSITLKFYLKQAATNFCCMVFAPKASELL